MKYYATTEVYRTPSTALGVYSRSSREGGRPLLCLPYTEYTAAVYICVYAVVLVYVYKCKVQLLLLYSSV